MWGGGCLEPPLGARGGPTRAAGLPDFRGSVLSVPVVGSRVVPVFFRSRKKASPWSFHLLPLALQRGEAMAPGQQRVRAFLPFLFPHSIPDFYLHSGGPPLEEPNLGMGAGPEAL